MPYKAEVYVWGAEYGRSNYGPQTYAIYRGLDCGHAAMKLTFPKKDQDGKDNSEIIKKIRDNPELNARFKIKDNGDCELYFSFWPAEERGKKHKLAGFIEDIREQRYGVPFEWDTNKEAARDILKEKRSAKLFGFITKFGRKPYTLGPETTVHFAQFGEYSGDKNKRERERVSELQEKLDDFFDKFMVELKHRKRYLRSLKVEREYEAVQYHSKTYLDFLNHGNLNSIHLGIGDTDGLEQILTTSLSKFSAAKEDIERAKKTYEAERSENNKKILKDMEENYKISLNNVLKIYGTVSNDVRENGIELFHLSNEMKREKNPERKRGLKLAIDTFKKDSEIKTKLLESIENALGEDLFLKHVTRGLMPKKVVLPLGNKGAEEALDLAKMVEKMDKISREERYGKFSMRNSSGTISRIIQEGIINTKMREKYKSAGGFGIATPQQVFSETLRTEHKYTSRGFWANFLKYLKSAIQILKGRSDTLLLDYNKKREFQARKAREKEKPQDKLELKTRRDSDQMGPTKI